MNLLLKRTRLREDYTGGQLYVEGNFFCFTLEDKVREVDGVAVDKWKVYGSTAIPKGLYKVTLETSPRFGPDTITVHKVPGFTGIRIHSGNTHKDTEGCIIVGYRITDSGVIVPGTTRTALNDLKRILKRADSDIVLLVE